MDFGDVDVAPAPSSTGSAISDFFSSVLQSGATAVNQAVVKQNATANLGTQSTPQYGVDQNGQLYLAGKATFVNGKIFGIPEPLVLVGLGVLAVTLLLRARKR